MNKGRYFGFVLYQETESYDIDVVLGDICSYFNEYSYITHDNDVDENGVLKKSHIHVVVKKSSSVLLTTIQNRYMELGVPSNHIFIIHSYKSQLRYLIHADDVDKVQYDLSDVVTSIIDLQKYFNQVPEGLMVLNFVDMKKHKMTLRDMIIESVRLGCYDVLRRNYSMIQLVVEEEWRNEHRGTHI